MFKASSTDFHNKRLNTKFQWWLYFHCYVTDIVMSVVTSDYLYE